MAKGHKSVSNGSDGHSADNSLFSSFVGTLDCSMSYLQEKLPPGPAFIPMNWIINTQKFGCWIFVLILMIYFDNYSTGCWIYIALHGSYGMCWIIKDFTFPDKTFQSNVTISSAIILAALLGMYLLAGYQMTSRMANNEPSLERILISFVMYFVGLFLMIGSDIQKYFILKYRQANSLIDYGFFKITRNPNYLGETMIYYSFAIIVDRWEFWFVLWTIHLAVFVPRMLIKDKSLSKKDRWDEYDSYLFFPKFSSCCLDNFIIYSFVIVLGLLIYTSGGFTEFKDHVLTIWKTGDAEPFFKNARHFGIPQVDLALEKVYKFLYDC